MVQVTASSSSNKTRTSRTRRRCFGRPLSSPSCGWMTALGTTLLLYLGVYYSSTSTLLEQQQQQQQQQQYPRGGVGSTHTTNPIPTSSTITNTVGVLINGGTEKNTSDNAAATTTAAAVITDTTTTILSSPPLPARRPPLLLAYGTKDLKGRTADLVEQAIRAGFRQIVTCGHHVKHDEAATGVGIQHATSDGVPRADLFLQSCFVPVENTQEFHFQPPTSLPEAGKDPDLPTRSLSVDEYAKLSIAEQVHASVQMSLQNLQTTYLDALVFHNFRAKVSNREHILQAWTVLEEYVESGIIHHLGLTSIHDPTWFADFYHHPRVRIKPTIVQNRFHANRHYDTGPMQDIFHSNNNNNNKQPHYPNLQVQRFWLLNGSSGYGRKNRAMAETKGVTPEQLLLGFVMSMNETCLVGTTSVQHMQDDLRIAQCYSTLFDTEHERNAYADKLGMHQQPPTQPLPGRRRSDRSNDRYRNSSAACSNSS